MRRVFADTNYLIAFFVPTDELHVAAQHASDELVGHVPLVSTWGCLSEFLAYASRRGAWMRSEAARLVERILASPDFEIVEEDEELHRAGLDLYRRRLDKTYSLVDCMSMVLCSRMKITEVLTGDRDFVQEGFAILL